MIRRRVALFLLLGFMATLEALVSVPTGRAGSPENFAREWSSAMWHDGSQPARRATVRFADQPIHESDLSDLAADLRHTAGQAVAERMIAENEGLVAVATDCVPGRIEQLDEHEQRKLFEALWALETESQTTPGGVDQASQGPDVLAWQTSRGSTPKCSFRVIAVADVVVEGNEIATVKKQSNAEETNGPPSVDWLWPIPSSDASTQPERAVSGRWRVNPLRQTCRAAESDPPGGSASMHESGPDLLQRLALIGVALSSALKNGVPWSLATQVDSEIDVPNSTSSTATHPIEPQPQIRFAPDAQSSISLGL